MKFLALAVVGTASAALGPQLLGGAAEYHRGLAEADVSLPDLVAPFALEGQRSPTAICP